MEKVQRETKTLEAEEEKIKDRVVEIEQKEEETFCPMIQITKEERKELCKPWQLALIIKLLDKGPSMKFLHAQLQKI